MALFDRFRRRDIRDHAATATFIDDQSFALALAAVQGYCRARAGARADSLFATASFSAALEKACWEAYPRALAMVGMVVEAALRPHAGASAHDAAFGLVALLLDRFDRRPVPAAIGAVDWRAARAALERSLTELARTRARTTDHAVQDQASFFLAIMPLHPDLAADDFPALRDLLRTSLQEVRDAFLQRATLPALATALAGQMPRTEPVPASPAPSS